MILNPGTRCLETGTKDINGDPLPYNGLTCTVLETYPMDRAGFDCHILIHCEPAQLAYRFGLAQGDQPDELDIVSWHECPTHLEGLILWLKTTNWNNANRLRSTLVVAANTDTLSPY